MEYRLPMYPAQTATATPEEKSLPDPAVLYVTEEEVRTALEAAAKVARAFEGGAITPAQAMARLHQLIETALQNRAEIVFPRRGAEAPLYADVVAHPFE